jgi:hypothetical protein
MLSYAFSYQDSHTLIKLKNLKNNKENEISCQDSYIAHMDTTEKNGIFSIEIHIKTSKKKLIARGSLGIDSLLTHTLIDQVV